MMLTEEVLAVREYDKKTGTPHLSRVPEILKKCQIE